MDHVQIENQDDVALVKLCRSKTNAIDLKLVDELSEALRLSRKDSQTLGVVLTSTTDKFFSIGFDIPSLFDLSSDSFKTFFRKFNSLCLDLYTYPKPIIAAITGHAIAGGCILALCCDYRFIAEGRKLMGLNEIKLGVPLPYPADRILDQLVGFRNAREITDSGSFYTPADSKHLGMVDEVLPIEEVQEKAAEKVRSLSLFTGDAFTAIKKDRTERTASLISSSLPEKEELFLACWFSKAARQRLKEAKEKF